MKLLLFYEDGRDALFNLSQDIGERADLSKQMPETTTRLRQHLDAYLAAVDAQFAAPNPQYDPSKPPPPIKKGGDRKMNPKKIPRTGKNLPSTTN